MFGYSINTWCTLPHASQSSLNGFCREAPHSLSSSVRLHKFKKPCFCIFSLLRVKIWVLNNSTARFVLSCLGRQRALTSPTFTLTRQHPNVLPNISVVTPTDPEALPFYLLSAFLCGR